jgi:hypothetical protein
MTRFRIRRALLVPAAAGALLVVPATTAMAASNSSSTSLSCTITVAGYITPGVTPQTQTVLVYSLGQSGTADCTGTIDGAAVTSPGRFGLVVEEDANCLTLSNGNGVFALSAPTASGTRTATGTFQINGPADTTTFTGALAGTEVSAVADQGTCFTTPLTEATTVLDLQVT